MTLRREWFDQFLYFRRLLDQVNDVDGDVVECGVAGGGTFSMLALLVRSEGRSRHLWGFDSWQGLPEPTEADLASAGSVAEAGIFAGKRADMVLDRLRRYGFSEGEIKSAVSLAEGPFSETLPGYHGRDIALLHLDADLYQSYVDCLQNLWPKVVVGGIVAFDEYQAPEEWPGARWAVDEFLGQLPEGSASLKHDGPFDRFYALKLA